MGGPSPINDRLTPICAQLLAAAAGMERPAREGEVEPWRDESVCDQVSLAVVLLRTMGEVVRVPCLCPVCYPRFGFPSTSPPASVLSLPALVTCVL